MEGSQYMKQDTILSVFRTYKLVRACSAAVKVCLRELVWNKFQGCATPPFLYLRNQALTQQGETLHMKERNRLYIDALLLPNSHRTATDSEKSPDLTVMSSSYLFLYTLYTFNLVLTSRAPSIFHKFL